ncbi:alpha/beta family hydrolase [Neobacillus sp. K501]
MYQIFEKELVRNEFSTIPYQLFRGGNPNKTLCIMLPGLGYTTQRPLFHYATGVCMKHEVDILHVNYQFVKNEHFSKLSELEQERWMYEDVKAVLDDVLEENVYEQCFLLSKSIGTIPMAMEWKAGHINQIAFGIWLTPLIKDDNVYEALLNTEIPSLCVIGDHDHHFLEERISSLKNNPLISTILIPNADHGLEVKGDLADTLEAIMVVMKSIEDFMGLHEL